jgi:DNA processing protein
MAKEETRRAGLSAALARCLDDGGLHPGPFHTTADDWIVRARDQLLALGVRALLPGAADFPARLLEIPDPPTHLFALGADVDWSPPAVAIVGSRRPSPSGRRFARELGRLLARHGVLVVSGLARGIDGEAHAGALSAGGAPTVAIVANGLDTIYPPEHRTLQSSIAASGLVLTEFPPGSAPVPFHFLRRNRLLSGLSVATVVVEARERSGALVTVEHALRQGREVFAVPGDVFNDSAAGTNRLIEQGATPLLSPGALLQWLMEMGGGGGLSAAASSGAPDGGGAARGARSPAGNAHPALAASAPDPGSFEHLDDRLRRIARLLERGVVSADDLARRAGVSPQSAWSVLLELELLGIARRYPGGFARG